MSLFKRLLFVQFALIATFGATSCSRSSDEVWDDTKSAGRHMGRSIRSIGGKHGDSKQIRSRDDFYSGNSSYFPPTQPDFVALCDDEGNQMINVQNMGSAYEPGDPNSGIPGIDAFRDPTRDPALASVFANLHFGYDSDAITGQENLTTIRNIATYLKSHPNTYVYIEGHCDERGPQAYNLALGTRRANMVRNALVAEGVSGSHLFTISYGKERPLVTGSNEDAWAKNRRAQFRVL